MIISRKSWHYRLRSSLMFYEYDISPIRYWFEVALCFPFYMLIPIFWVIGIIVDWLEIAKNKINLGRVQFK